MGKAIAIALLFVVLGFGFVLSQLSGQASQAARAGARPGPALVAREDGSVYAVSLQLARFEQRLMEEEERSQKLLGELQALREERARLEERLTAMQEEVRRLRRQLHERADPPEASQPPAGPSAVPPPANVPSQVPAPAAPETAP